MSSLKLLLCFLLCSGALLGKDVFVSEVANGGDDGATQGSAHSVAWLNAASSWGSGATQINAGDRIVLCGVVKSQILVNVSGTADAPITVLFGPGARMSQGAWGNSGAINLMRADYVTIDGGATGQIGGDEGNVQLSNGVIENTANGTTLGNQVDSFGIKAQECKFLTIKNLIVRNMYVRTPGTDTKAFGTAISCKDTNGNGVANLVVSNCVISDAFVGIESDYGPGDHDYEFSFNTISHCNWGAVCGDRTSTSTLSGLRVHHNKFSEWSNWNDASHNSFHHNGFFAYANAGTLTKPTVFANTFGPGFGNEFQTSGVYINGNVVEPIIYNNLFVARPQEYAANGLITLSSTLATNLRIYNNTFFCGGAGAAAVQMSGTSAANQFFDIKNNLGVGNGAGTFMAIYNGARVSLSADRNIGSGFRSDVAYIYSASSNGDFKTFQQWQALGMDPNGSTAAPTFVDPARDYHLAPVDTTAANHGTDLSAWFSVDKEGKERPQAGVWDVGAYERSSPPKAPANVRFNKP
jgi:hypothetical protein